MRCFEKPWSISEWVTEWIRKELVKYICKQLSEIIIASVIQNWAPLPALLILSLTTYFSLPLNANHVTSETYVLTNFARNSAGYYKSFSLCCKQWIRSVVDFQIWISEPTALADPSEIWKLQKRRNWELHFRWQIDLLCVVGSTFQSFLKCQSSAYRISISWRLYTFAKGFSLPNLYYCHILWVLWLLHRLCALLIDHGVTMCLNNLYMFSGFIIWILTFYAFYVY